MEILSHSLTVTDSISEHLPRWDKHSLTLLSLSLSLSLSLTVNPSTCSPQQQLAGFPPAGSLADQVASKHMATRAAAVAADVGHHGLFIRHSLWKSTVQGKGSSNGPCGYSEHDDVMQVHRRDTMQVHRRGSGMGGESRLAGGAGGGEQAERADKFA